MNDQTLPTYDFASGYEPYTEDETRAPMPDGDGDIANDAFLNYAQANAPKQTDETYPRYGMSFLLPVPIYRQHGNNTYGDFNPKNPDGTNRLNLNYFPPFTLMPFFGVTVDIPYENQATSSTEPPKAAPFDYAMFKDQPLNGFSDLTRSAKECADLFYRETRNSGSVLFQSLIGYEVGADDKGLMACRKLVQAIMPLGDQLLLPRSVRIKDGVAFRGPFLNEILRYVEKHALQAVLDNPRLDRREKEKAEELHGEIRAGLRTAIALANTILNDTESEIKDPNGMKRAYDPPNLSIPDAPVSTDLYCLAHTNRTEMEDKQLRASENISKGMSEPLMGVIQEMKNISQNLVAAQNSAPQMMPLPENVMTLEQVEEMMSRQAKMFQKQMEEMRAAFTPAAPPPVPPAPAANSAAAPPADTKTAKKS